jgi:D-apiose dehydrogenase
MRRLKFAMFGTGFWARYQLAGWRELPGAECVALYNRTISKAQALAQEFEISAVYDNPEELLDKEKLDFVDVVTDVDHHGVFVKMAADHKIPVVCQKPIASTLSQAENNGARLPRRRRAAVDKRELAMAGSAARA